MFTLRKEFMSKLLDKFPNYYPEWPVDPTKKENQRLLRDINLKGVEEMFEAIQHLKNSKDHRISNIEDFNKEEYLEECIDAFNFFLTSLVLLGFTSEDIISMYQKKHEIIKKRLENGY
jgi:hypothetical protein